MDLQPSGNKSVTLITLKTKKVKIIIKGSYKASPFKYSKDIFISRARVQCFPKDDLLEFDTYGEEALFYEHEDYEIIIKSLDERNKVEFQHENKLIRDKVSYLDESEDILTGVLNFKNEIGFSDLVVLVNGFEHIKLTVEVFPKKLDYKNDYYNILFDVNEEIYNLSFEFLRRTYLGVHLSQKEDNSLVEYYSILNHIYKNLIKSLNVILMSPHHNLIKEKSMVSYNKLKRVNNDMIKWLNKHPENVVKSNDKIIPIAAMQTKKSLTFDTYENQFLKFMILSIIEKLKVFKKSYNDFQREKDERVIRNIDNIIRDLSNYLRKSFLNSVSSFTPRESFSLVLKMAPGYKEVYKYYLMLKRGLTLQGDLLKLSMKDLALLYEYWCFIKINSILRKKYKMIQNDIIKINTNGIFVTLKKGTRAKVSYLNPATNEKFTISYNQGMTSKTVNQKPDNVLTIIKDGNNKVRYNYIFDAKYKIDYAEEGSYYKKEYNTPGPKEEDINTMHRYRDAIVSATEDKFQRDVFGAFVLFPYHDEEEYMKHYFYETIDKVNIGAMPFLPSTTVLVEKFLDELIGESSYSSFERSLSQSGNDEYLKEEYFSSREVLVGSLSNKEQLDICLKNNFYHTKLKNVDLSKHNISTIALSQSKNLFGENSGVRFYGKVKEIQILPRKEITEIPKTSEELYIRFEIEKWNELKDTIKVKGYQVRNIMYTSKFLLHNATTISELCIKSKEQFRLWVELKRIFKDMNIESNENMVSETSELKGFNINGNDVYISDGCIKAVKNEKRVFSCPISDFIKKPSSIVKDLEKSIMGG